MLMASISCSTGVNAVVNIVCPVSPVPPPNDEVTLSNRAASGLVTDDASLSSAVARRAATCASADADGFNDDNGVATWKDDARGTANSRREWAIARRMVLG